MVADSQDGGEAVTTLLKGPRAPPNTLVYDAVNAVLLGQLEEVYMNWELDAVKELLLILLYVVKA